MSLISSQLDSLPYIDTAPTDAQRAALTTLIASELPPNWSTTPHPSLSLPSSSSSFPSSLSSPPPKLDAIDTTRYDSAALTAPDSDPSDPTHLAQWRATVRRAYTLYTYLSARDQQLALLEAYGRNAWLVGNSQLEEELGAVERRLKEVREATEEVNRGRRERQEGVRGELEGLEGAWREGVGRLVGVLVARAELEAGNSTGAK